MKQRYIFNHFWYNSSRCWKNNRNHTAETQPACVLALSQSETIKLDFSNEFANNVNWFQTVLWIRYIMDVIMMLKTSCIFSYWKTHCLKKKKNFFSPLWNQNIAFGKYQLFLIKFWQINKTLVSLSVLLSFRDHFFSLLLTCLR